MRGRQARPAAAEQPAKAPAPPKPAVRRLRSVQRPVSQLLQDEIDRLDDPAQKK